MSISSVSGSSSSWLDNIFKRTDANADGQVTKDEFLSARPKDVSTDQASALFDSLDTSASGSLTETQFSQGLAQKRPVSGDSASLQGNLGSDVVAALLQMIQNGTTASGDTASTSATATSDSQTKAAELFAKIDTNGDGTISKDEFLANRPKDMSEDQASALFDKIADGSSSISKDQFAQAAPVHHHHHHGAGAPPPADDDDSTQNSDSLFVSNQPASMDILSLLTGSDDDATDTATAATTTTTTASAATSASAKAAAAEAYLQQLFSAASAYRNTSYATQTTSLLLSA